MLKNIKQVYRRWYVRRRSPKPNLHQKNKKNTFCWTPILSHFCKSVKKLIPHTKFYWKRAIGGIVMTRDNSNTAAVCYLGILNIEKTTHRLSKVV